MITETEITKIPMRLVGAFIVLTLFIYISGTLEPAEQGIDKRVQER